MADNCVKCGRVVMEQGTFDIVFRDSRVALRQYPEQGEACIGFGSALVRPQTFSDIGVPVPRDSEVLKGYPWKGVPAIRSPPAGPSSP